MFQGAYCATARRAPRHRGKLCIQRTGGEGILMHLSLGEVYDELCV